MKFKFILIFITSILTSNIFCANIQDLLNSCASGNIESVKNLINSGISPNGANGVGVTPLHIAAMCNKYEIAKFLIKSGANVNLRDAKGNTPLQYAKSDNVLKLLKYAKNKTSSDNNSSDKNNYVKVERGAPRNQLEELLEELLLLGLIANIENDIIKTYTKSQKTKKLKQDKDLSTKGARTGEKLKDKKKQQEKIFTFKDLAGKIPEDIREITEFIKNPERFHKLGAQMPRGILLVGPPGTGKTSIARAIAGEGQAAFFNSSATEFIELYVGQGPKRVRELFDKAREAISSGKYAKAIIFIDELDAIGGARGMGNDCLEYRNTLNELLNQMDGFDRTENITVIAATNTPEFIDPALKRPGRFDRIVTIGLPDLESREQILQHYVKSIKHEPKDLDIKKLANSLDKFSPADIKNLINEAAIRAARENATTVKQNHFDSALESIIIKKKQEQCFIA